MFSSEFCKILKITFFTEHLLATASEVLTILYMFSPFSFVFINASISSLMQKSPYKHVFSLKHVFLHIFTSMTQESCRFLSEVK